MDEKAIELLCQKFHTTVDNLIPVYSHYIVSKDIVSIIICAVLIIISAIIIYVIYKNHDHDFCYDFTFTDAVASIICPTIILISFICLLYTVYDCVLWINCPEMRFLDTVLTTK